MKSAKNALPPAEKHWTCSLGELARAGKTGLSSRTARAAVATFLEAQPTFDIRTTPIHEALRNDRTLAKLKDDGVRKKAVDHLKALQRIQAVAPSAEAASVLLKAGLHSAWHVAEMGQSSFVKAHARTLGASVARHVHANAVDVRLRNEHVLMAAHDAAKGTGIALLDGDSTPASRSAAVSEIFVKRRAPFEITRLFGAPDLCECDDCNSVFSPAAYFVELLQYLRNNNLDSETPNPNTGQSGYAGTPLEKLFLRRPDLRCLELTCANTFTELPYVDLVNEVMEGFVVDLPNYVNGGQAMLPVFNVDGEPSEELLAQPQHINYAAYCALKNAPYPFSLPYHQPIDATRILLGLMKTSREELLRTFATEIELVPATVPAASAAALQDLHREARRRAVQAEALDITQEDYVILTREAFWPKQYFDLTTGHVVPLATYHEKIGIKPLHAYYGYATQAQMLGTDPSATPRPGLTFVAQFLRSTGLAYADLVALLCTRTINPGYPQGRALTVTDSVRASYRAMQLLVGSPGDPHRFDQLIAQLKREAPIWAHLNPDPCNPVAQAAKLTSQDLTRWVKSWFERIGRLIVIESGDGPTLPVSGTIYALTNQIRTGPREPLGTLNADGSIVDEKGVIIGEVTLDGRVIQPGGQPFAAPNGVPLIVVDPTTGDTVATIEGGRLEVVGEGRELQWLAPTDSCDLNKARLLHLDGSAVTPDEYDRMHRFIRLWRRLGWTIDETDKALLGYAAPTGNGPIVAPVTATPPLPGSPPPPAAPLPPPPPVQEGIDLGAFKDDCSAGAAASPTPAAATQKVQPAPPLPSFDITPAMLEQFVAIRKLQAETGQPLICLLALWSDISTAGDGSLYARLFLTYNVSALDPVFKSDINGNYLATPAKISDHVPAIMAALQIGAADVAAIVALRAVPDVLTLANLSLLYRHALLARILGVRARELGRVLAVFGDPFVDAATTRKFRRTWLRMQAAGFTYKQLDYIVNADAPSQGPSMSTLLQLCKTLCDGLRSIVATNPVPQAAVDATDDAVRAAAGQLFDTQTVERIVGLLDGTTQYVAQVQPAAPGVPSLGVAADKMTCTAGAGANPTIGVQVTGILDAVEAAAAGNALNDPAWQDAINAIMQLPSQFFDDTLAGFIDATTRTTLLTPDVVVPGSQIAPNATIDPNTAPGKRLAFLVAFVPFLRQRLSTQLIIDRLSALFGLDGDVTQSLLVNVLTTGNPAHPVLDDLLALANAPAVPPGVWSGYLVAPASDSFTLSVAGNPPAALQLAGRDLTFTLSANGASSSTPALSLTAGNLYFLSMPAALLGQLSWKRASSPLAAIPDAALLSATAFKSLQDICTVLAKAALVVNGFGITSNELLYLQAHSANFDGLDFNAITLTSWRRLEAYARLRGATPGTWLIDLFAAIAALPDASGVPAAIALATSWDVTSVASLVAPAHFNIAAQADFHDERNLLKLKRALTLSTRTGMDVDRLFDWADPGSGFWSCHAIAESVRRSLQARYVPSEWDAVVKPLNDRLRDNQRQALIAYLLVQQPLVDWGVVDADSLFEFFLIDVQMGTCLPTSRIKQGIASVQQFVFRCLQGLEDPSVRASALDRDRWAWMESESSWELNRRTFVYPENSLQASLRDDKSPFYQALESELLQKDIDPDLIESALHDYLFALDEVSNIDIVGLHVQSPGTGTVTVLHVFGRTRNTPHSLYYRTYTSPDATFADGNWTAWEPMQVEITTYETDVDDQTGAPPVSGVYLAPVVWDGRVLVFFPEFVKKSVAEAGTQADTFEAMSKKPVNGAKANDYWEIKLAWTERRGGKWTQKQVSSDRMLHCVQTMTDAKKKTLVQQLATTPAWGAQPTGAIGTTSLTDVSRYLFIPSVVSAEPSLGGAPCVSIEVAYAAASSLLPAQTPAAGEYAVAGFGQFLFTGNTLLLVESAAATILQPDTSPTWQFQAVLSDIVSYCFSLQSDGSGGLPYYGKAPASFALTSGTTLVLPGANFQAMLYGAAHPLVSASATKDFSGLYDEFHLLTGSSVTVMAPAYGATLVDSALSYSELKQPYSLYNWEFGFHAPMALIDKMSSARQFDAALDVFHVVFDPTSGATDGQPWWLFPPFKAINPMSTLEAKLQSLQPDAPDADVQAWRDNPFQPHVVARGRPSAYMRWTVLQYIQLLIDYGDSYFRQNTLESVPLAIQCYVLASHVLGPRPQVIPKQGKIAPETYESLVDRWDAFSDAMVELELVFPFSNQTTQAVVSSNGVTGLPNIFGFATSLYFGIPANARLTSLRSLIDNRLYNIRHCCDINGVPRSLSLFDFDLDADLLAQAEAQGLTVATALDDLSAPVPNYRFNYLLQKAYAFAAEVKALGGAYVSARERGDAEGLAALRAAHESALYQLTLDVKQAQLDEANQALEALQQNRLAPVARLQHYLRLIGGDLSQVPTPDADFAQIDDPIEAPIADSGLVLSPYEKQEMDAAAQAALVHEDVGQLESLSSALSIIPEIGTSVQPLGLGITLQFGGHELSAIVQALARKQQVLADMLSFDSSNAARKGGYLRQLQDRVLQANLAGLDIKSIDKQILTQQIRIDVATKEIAVQQQQIADAQAIVDFLQDKYTNQQLYTWMQNSLRALHYQGYLLAYDMACRAEAVYRFERAPAGPSFLASGYWDASHDGLLAGETMEMALRQMEAAYVANRPYDFEITRPPLWLRDIDPLALIQLRATGTCEFTLQEFQFDRDFPGHYLRRVKTLGLEIPCVVGPGVSLSGTLTLLQHRFRTNAGPSSTGSGYAEDPGGDDRFTTLNVPIGAIAVCGGQSEHGAFEMSFEGERYLPFEGAGVISRWRLELPSDFRPFDYDTISDVGIRLQYTTRDGGAMFKNLASQHLAGYLAGTAETLGPRDGLFVAFELARDFPEQWYRGTQPDSNGLRQFTIDSLVERLPHAMRYAKGMLRATGQIVATDSWFVHDTTVPVQPGSATFAGVGGMQTDPSVYATPGTLVVESATAISTTSDQWAFGFVFAAAPTTSNQCRAWLVLRYTVS